jgi:biopolymer transport protein ExbD
MAGFMGPGSDDPIVSINVTPLVDITLVLLIIFIVTAKFMVTPSVPLDLPEAVKTDEIQTVLSISVPSQGSIQVNGTALSSDDEIMQFAREGFERDRELRAVIAADGSVPHRRIIGLMDRLRRSGITRIAFSATPVSEEP